MSIRLRSINSFVTVILIILAIGSAPVAADTYYFHTDHLGTPQALTDTNQQVVWQGEYSPFGEVSESVNAVTQNLRFPGQYFDNETGLHYNYFRDYDLSLGRYTQSDPIGLEGGLNTYAYVGGNPLSYTDPYGLVCGTGVGVGIGITRGVQLGYRFYKGHNAAQAAIALAEAVDDGGQCPVYNSAQDKKLSKGEIDKLIGGGVHPHDLKDNSKQDLFKDPDGNIVVKPKAGNGPGEPTGININDFF